MIRESRASNQILYTTHFTGLLLLFSWFSLLNAQTANDSIPPQRDQIINEEGFHQRIESLVEESDTDLDYAELLEELEFFLQNPINLNTATADELRRLFLLNDIQIINLINHISMFGKLISIYELQSIESFDTNTIRAIQPYVSISEELKRRHFNFDDMMKEGKNQLFIRYQQLLEEQKGFSAIKPSELEKNPNARYPGSPYRLYTRYRFSYYNNISVGITAEKDPGEEFFQGTQPKGYDFYSGHLHLRDFGKLKTLSLGDYQVQFGQGLTLWSGLAFGKSSEAINVKKNGLGLRQYTSVDENNFFRGGGATIDLGILEFTAFFSSKKKDANILHMDTLEQDELVITSLQQTGLHRTPRELEGKHAVNETIYGGNLGLRRSNFSLGITAYAMKLDADYQRRLSFYNQFDFTANDNTNFGLDYSYIYRNMNFFGEAALSQNGGHALLNGIMMSLDSRLSLSIVHRKFSKDYQSHFAAAFSENTRVVNENGMYIGLQTQLSKEWRITAYADHFSFPWMKFRTYMPSSGYDYLAQVDYKPNRMVEIYARYRIKNKPLNTQHPDKIRHLEDVKRENYRVHFGYVISPSFTLKNRIEYINFQFGERKEKGYVIYQDVSYRHYNSPLALTIRYALFDTNGYDSRIYAYENDVLYAFSFPFYSDTGTRIYLLARYRIHRNVDIYARLSQTVYTNRDETGSNLEMIEGKKRTEIKAQVRIRF